MHILYILAEGCLCTGHNTTVQDDSYIEERVSFVWILENRNSLTNLQHKHMNCFFSLVQKWQN